MFNLLKKETVTKMDNVAVALGILGIIGGMIVMFLK